MTTTQAWVTRLVLIVLLVGAGTVVAIATDKDAGINLINIAIGVALGGAAVTGAATVAKALNGKDAEH